MKLAGYPSGKYTGGRHAAASSAPPANQRPDVAQIVNQTLLNLGFKTHLSLVDNSDDAREVLRRSGPATSTSAPTSAGCATSPIPQTVLDLAFNGRRDRTRRQLQLEPGQRFRDQRRDGKRPRSSSANRPRAEAWAKIDEMLVERAVAAPEVYVSFANYPGSRASLASTSCGTVALGLRLHLAEVAAPRRAPTGPAARGESTLVMARYVLRRVLWGVALLVIVAAVTFVLFDLLPSGDPARLRAGHSASPQTIAYIRHDLGLDKPLYAQFYDYVKGVVLHFDLGYSYYSHASVKSLIADRLPATISLAAGAIVIWLLVGICRRHRLGRAPRARCSTARRWATALLVHLGARILARAARAVPVRSRHRQVRRLSRRRQLRRAERPTREVVHAR